MEIVQFVTDALGDSSYLAVSAGEAAVIDPQRDVRPYLAAAEARRVRITTVVETHVHNDYVSGGPELAALGATIVAPAGSGIAFTHRPIEDGGEVRVGEARLQAVLAPGHTHHHTAYLAVDEAGGTVAGFTGGSIIVGGAGRTDLLGDTETEALTRLQYDSAQRIAALLPGHGEVLPTHGAGSFCSTSESGERRSTLDAERTQNALLTSEDFESFRRVHLHNPAPIPGYYRHIAPINRAGPPVFAAPPRPASLRPDDAPALIDAAVPLVDVRSRFEYVRGHVPGSVLIEESGSMLAYVGWLLPFDTPLGLIAGSPEQAERVTVDLWRIGYEHVRGALAWQEWHAAGRPEAHVETVTREEARERRRREALPLLDVRHANEHHDDPRPGTRPMPFEDLPRWVQTLEDEQVLLACASGMRSAIAASFIQRTGTRPIVLVDGHVADVTPADA